MRVIPTQQVLDKDGKLEPIFLDVLKNRCVTFRSHPEVAQKMRLLGPEVDWSRHIFLYGEHEIPKHDHLKLHMFIHAHTVINSAEQMRGHEMYVVLEQRGTVTIS